MRKYKTLILILVILIGGWVLYHKDQIKTPGDAVSLAGRKLKAWSASWSSGNQFNGNGGTNGGSYGRVGFGPNGEFANQTIRIASFKLGSKQQFGSALDIPSLAGDICSRFDLVAIQADNIPADFLRRLSVAASQKGRQYELVEGPINRAPLLGRDAGQKAGGATQQFAFLFDRNTIQMDDNKWYLVNDPDHILGNDPMVGWFRSKAARPEEAFTFSLANVSLAERRNDTELIFLGQLFREIRNDGRGEDDILLAGDFNAGNRGLEPIAHQNGFVWAIQNRPTNIQNTRQFDNVVFNQQATVEFLGQSDVVDFMRVYNLRMNDALAVSEHMPVWADFSIYEGRLPGRVASGEDTDRQSVR